MASYAEAGTARAPRDLSNLLRSGASMLAICAIAAATPAYAQTTPPADLEDTAGETQDSADNAAPETRISDSTDAEGTIDESGDDAIIVTGIRQSLANSQNIKRNSDTVVDAITAEDIGALPDRSVTEALQRVPGVAINRFAGSNDPDHFSVEGSGVVIRGLNFVRSEFNGRDTFSANAGRQLGFADVPSELLGSVEVYKNVTAEMIEGGLAGTVNLNTRVPFDNKGFHFGFSAEANYSDFVKEVTPTASILVSNTWDTPIGTFGLLGSFAYSQVKSRADGMQVTNFQTRDANIVTQAFATNQIRRNRLPGTETCAIPSPAAGGPTSESGVRCTAFAPIGATFRTQEFDRERAGYAGAAQWQSNDRSMLLTAQFLRSDARQRWNEYTFETAGDLSEYNTFPVGCNNQNAQSCGGANFDDYEYDEDNVFESGFITFPGNGWRSGASNTPGARVPTGGTQYNNARREVLQDTSTSDYGLNFKWNATDRISINLDGQYVSATTENLDFQVVGSIFADTELDISGDIPQAVLHKPRNLQATWATPNTRLGPQSDSEYFGRADNYFWRSAMDHIEDSEGTEWAFKGDIAYDFQEDIPGLRKIKFGARYADRDQTVRSTGYNWGVLSEVWGGNAGEAVYFDESPQLPIQQRSFNNFFRGQAAAPPPSYYYDLNLINAYQTASEQFKAVNQQWNIDRGATAPATGGGSGWVPLAERPNVIAGTPFLPSEIQNYSEATKSAYAMLSFGSDEPIFGNVRIDGNIGVRYVHTSSVSAGSIALPQTTAIGGGQPFTAPDGPDANTDGDGFCDPRSLPIGAPPGTPAPLLPAICAIGPANYALAQTFSNGAIFPNVGKMKFSNWLPSLNVKLGVGQDVIVRFAASKVLSRPDIGYTRNFLNISPETAAGAGFRFVADAGNPFVKPVTAWTFDAGIEWYFAKVGSLTFNAFYKDIKGFFYSGVTERSVTNNGVTFPVFVRGPTNFPENGNVKGFEVAYQQTFDFLPGLLSGLGVNANYTHVKSKGVPNALLATTTAPQTGEGNLPLEQLSKHNANASLFYEKGPLSMRASYSWRSKFLLTARDVIFPYFPIYNDSTGQLDASIFYSVTKEIKVGFQAVNLLNEITKTIQVFTADGREA
ncbi:MAG TPA: TonB-dependent receptor, partial [Allosphingosinicella sp.]